MIWQKIKPYLNLIRFQNQIGTIFLFIPCFYGMFYSNIVSIYTALLFFVSAFFARSCGCILNDIADKKIDKNLPTTSHRVLASETLSTKQALFFFAILVCISLPLLFFYSNYIFVPLIIIGFVVILYPYTKRFFAIPQLFLGLVYASGFLISTVHVKNIPIWQLPIDAFYVYFSLVLWVIFYDTIYAKRDFKHDQTLKINSSAVFFAKEYNIIFPMLFLFFCVSVFCVNLYSWFIILVTIIISFAINKKLTKQFEEAKINNILFFLCAISNIILLSNLENEGMLAVFFAMILQIVSVFLPPLKGFKLNAWCILFTPWAF